MRRCGWGASMVGFGAWELAAFASRRRIPTVTASVARLLGCRHRRATQVAVVAYTAGLACHLLRPPAA